VLLLILTLLLVPASFQPLVNELHVPCRLLAGAIAATAGLVCAPGSITRDRHRFASGHSGA
jgi:hypothetical protein